MSSVSAEHFELGGDTDDVSYAYGLQERAGSLFEPELNRSLPSSGEVQREEHVVETGYAASRRVSPNRGGRAGSG